MFRKPTRWWLSSAAHGNNVGMTSGTPTDCSFGSLSAMTGDSPLQGTVTWRHCGPGNHYRRKRPRSFKESASSLWPFGQRRWIRLSGAVRPGP
jgi:hypothetical protein